MQIGFFFQAEDGIRDLVRSRGLGDVYKRQLLGYPHRLRLPPAQSVPRPLPITVEEPDRAELDLSLIHI